MHSGNLTRPQVAAIAAKVDEMVKYLHALNERMHERGFPPEDDLARLAFDAQAALNKLQSKLARLK